MEDSRAIENLIYRYAELIDNGDLDAVAELFRNAEITSRNSTAKFVGYDAVLSLYKKSCRLYAETGTPRTKHLTTNVIIELDTDGTKASARSYYTVIQATDAFPLQPIISGRYLDRFQKQDTLWVFASREMVIDLVGDCSAHLLYDAKSVS